MPDLNRLSFDATSVINLACWCICFWWMHRISKRQDSVLHQLRDQAHRIERVSEEEHEILTELRPSVQKIERDLGNVSEKVHETEST